MNDFDQAAKQLQEGAATKLFENEVQNRHRLFLDNELIKARRRPIERTPKPKSQCLAEAMQMREELEVDYCKQRDYLDGRIAEFREDQ